MNTRISAEEFRQAMAGKPKSKYRNEPITIDGVRYDSKREATYILNLRLREKEGEVYGIELQKRYALIGPDGLLITTYVADATFWDQKEKRFRIIDVKGVETAVFKIKKKLMKSLLGLDVEIVK